MVLQIDTDNQTKRTAALNNFKRNREERKGERDLEEVQLKGPSHQIRSA
jgi:hypothetical protein